MDGDQFVCLVQTLAPERLTKVLFPSLHLTITVIVHCRHRYTGKTAEEAGMVHAARPDAHSTLQEAVKIATALGGRNYDRTVYQQIKLQMFKTEIERLEIRHAVPQGPPNLSKL
jgi:hypothetical protein